MAVGGNDFALSRVTPDAKRPMWQILMIRLGALACVSQLMLGAALGYGMTFWGALAATLVGSVLLQVVSWAIGSAAAKEGMSTSLLSRWSGFGKMGSAVIGGVIALSLVGWFGVQNAVFAEGMVSVTNTLNFPIWAAITGMAITVLVVFGIKAIAQAANIFVPLFVLAVLYAAYRMLQGHDLGALLSTPPPGPTLTFAAATTMVAGGFMVGAVTTPDTSRYLSTPKQVFWMTLIGTFVGELGMNLIAVLLAHATGTDNVVDIMINLTGWLGAAIVVASTIKLNDMNLYSSSLGLSTAINALFDMQVRRQTLTWILGIGATLLSMAGILDHFTDFLSLLGVAIPPIAGIIVVDYYVLRRDRRILDESRARGELPETVDVWNPAAIVVWIVAFLVGLLVNVGIPAMNSLLGAALLYWIVMTILQRRSGTREPTFRRTTAVV